MSFGGRALSRLAGENLSGLSPIPWMGRVGKGGERERGENKRKEKKAVLAKMSVPINNSIMCLKNAPRYCDDNFVKFQQIFKILSLLESPLNLQ